MENKQPTKKEIEKAKENAREIALKNLKQSKLLDLAITYFVDEKDSGYGENVNSAVEEEVYNSARKSGPNAYDFESGEEYNLMEKGVLDSRKRGKRYSGKYPSEYDVLEKSANVIQRSLAALKVEDIFTLLGKTFNIKEAYKGKYISDLLQSKNEEEQKLAQGLIGGYMQYQTTKRVSEALNKRAENTKSGLESLVRAEG